MSEYEASVESERRTVLAPRCANHSPATVERGPLDPLFAKFERPSGGEPFCYLNRGEGFAKHAKLRQEEICSPEHTGACRIPASVFGWVRPKYPAVRTASRRVCFFP
jgi:hypothetical protein